MPSRKEIFSAIPYHRLRKIVADVRNECPREKAELVESLVKATRHSVARILDRLTVAELRIVSSCLSMPNMRRSKSELIAQITRDKKLLLRSRIISSLRKQGFRITNGRITLPHDINKVGIRTLHRDAVAHRRSASGRYLAGKEDSLLEWIADGHTLDVDRISPKLVEVLPRSNEELIFRYATLHWSIPVSAGYGRRLRFLVVDETNSKLIGVIGLGDPVFALAARDNWIGWDLPARKQRLHHVIDAYALGAIPPYSNLLCGKLVSLLATSDAVLSRFKEKYGGRAAVISGTQRTGDVALISTTSALGRSSVYNRLRFCNEKVFHSVGFTKGSGEFQFLNGLYEELAEFASERLTPTAKNKLWGKGFRNRREVVMKSLKAAGLAEQLLYHGVEREVFLVPTANNTREFLKGTNTQLDYANRSATDIIAWFKERWLTARAERCKEFRKFRRDNYRLWQ